MQQVIERRAGRHRTRGLLVPVAEQLGFAPGEQVVAPAVFGVAPVTGLVHQLLGSAGGEAVFHQAYFHFIDTAGQWPGVQGLQAGGHGLGVDQQAVAINLYRCLTVGGDVDRVHAGLGVVDRQAVGAAVHDAQGSVGAGAEAAKLTGQAIGIGGEVAKAKKLPFQFTLGIQLMNRVAHGLVITALARQLQVEHLAPVAHAGTGLQTITAAEAVLLTAIEVELVVDDQPQAAAVGLVVKARGFATQFNVLREDRQLRAFQIVVSRDHLLRARLGAGAQRHAFFQQALPGVAGGSRHLAVAGVGEFEQGDAVIPGQHDQRFAKQLVVQVYAHRQGYIEKVIGKACGQALGLSDQAAGRGCTGSSRCRQRTRTYQQRKRSRDRRHREHERIL
ncbi:hypothetical protein PFLmoz3_00912 [Pseudomonas fluorescens]|uniref:Uncharacterized protein n=1 Tax=Pseudomonas fluorescens TaxID=294 RepID=A0A109LLB9_PSEFL|nr:hypothetical protein PFLmoz3_00912 [Pseudomonas fluorescens]